MDRVWHQSRRAPRPPSTVHCSLSTTLRRLALAVVALASVAVGASRGSVPRVRAVDALPDLQVFRQALVDRALTYRAATRTLTTADLPPEDIRSGEATVTFVKDVDGATAAPRIASLGAAIVDTIPALNVYRVRLASGVPVDQGIVALQTLPGAVRAEPVPIVHLDFHPNDPLYQQYQSYLQLIHAEQAWDIQQGDPRIVAAVVDSGVDVTHPDLQGQIWNNPRAGLTGCGNDSHGCNFVDPAAVDASCPNRTTEPVPNPDIRPYYFHGTFVAGVLGAVTNNGVGMAGIVPHATIMPVKIGDCMNPITTAMASGILYAVNNGAAVINLSVGGSRCNPMPSYVLDAIADAERRGVVVVAASGNDGRTARCVGSPANYEGVIAVGAVTAAGSTRAQFSQWGPEISVVAPGVNIMGTVPTRDKPAPLDLYDQNDGTSFSTPIVSGLAVLLLSQNPLLTPELVKTLIREGALPLPDGNEPGWAGAGRVDLARSLQRVPAAYYGRALVTGTPAPEDTIVEARIGGQVCGTGVTFTSQGVSLYTLFVRAASEQSGCGAPGAQISFTIAGRAAGMAAWRAAAVPLDLDGRTAPATPVSPGIPGRAAYHSGWNLVGGPTGTFFSGAQSPLYTLQPGDRNYRTLIGAGPARGGYGYWAYFKQDATVTLGPDVTSSYVVQVPPGQWVMIGNPSGSLTLGVSGADSVLTFDPLASMYSDTRSLQPGQGAWVFVAAGGEVDIQ